MPQGHWVTLLNRLPTIDGANFGDPDEFRPERWIDDAATGGAHDPSAHMPFGSGPRICPGRSLALTEMKLLLAMLYGSFEVARVGEPRAQETNRDAGQRPIARENPPIKVGQHVERSEKSSRAWTWCS